MASQMKSAGNVGGWAGSLPSSNGKWPCAVGIDPESNQASSTGSSRRAVPSHPSAGHGKVTSST